MHPSTVDTNLISLFALLAKPIMFHLSQYLGQLKQQHFLYI